MASSSGIRIAVEGCCHGELDNIYSTLQQLERRTGKKIDLLICCGDFQAVRNLDDLETMACPVKYRQLGTFWQYYSGQKVAPYPTLFVGGNHECVNYLWELYHGGWAAPNIYFLGAAGVVNFGGLRIAGLSGIFKENHYKLGHFERPPYNDGSMRSAYHVRALEVGRLLQLSGNIDVFASHDWPLGIAHHGNTQRLLQRKAFLRSEVESNTLGSPPNAQLLSALRPRYWFSAHLHTKFAALVPHPDGSATRFLALDKCLPRRQFLQVVEFPEATGPKQLQYDPEWLAILRATHSLTSLQRHPRLAPDMSSAGPPAADVAFVEAALAARGGSTVPPNFATTAPPATAATPQRGRGRMPSVELRNPQTVALFELIGRQYNLDHGDAGWAPAELAAVAAAGMPAANPEELDIDDVEDDAIPDGNEAEACTNDNSTANGSSHAERVLPSLAAVLAATSQQGGRIAQSNPEELMIDSDEDDVG